MATDMQDFRSALGRFATGVTVVTTLDAEGRPIGLTANSFNSVSLDPPMVLWSLARRSVNLQTFLDAGHFAVNVLAADQRALSDRFARPADDRFAGVDWQAGTAGVPVLTGATASFECATDTRIDGGDHVIFLGRVARFRHADKEPLIYHADATAPRPEAGERPAASGRFVDGYLLYLLARASSIASAEFHGRVKARGIPIPVWRILAVLKGTAGVTVGELAARCLANQPTITKTVDKMQAQGLVVRIADAGDRRRVFVRLTPDGEALVDELIADARSHQDRLVRAMGVAESRVLVDALQRLIASAGSDC